LGPSLISVFTEVLKEFRRDITRNVWTFLKNPALASLQRGKSRIRASACTPALGVRDPRAVPGASVGDEVTN